MNVSLRRVGVLAAATAVIFATLAPLPASAHDSPSAYPPHNPPPAPAATDRARYILPPGNYGGLPTTDNSLDQLPLYDGLTPLRGNVTDADIDSHYIPEDFKPVGATHEEVTGHPGTTIVYDSFGVPHVTGKTRADLAFGAGWVTARDRTLLLQLGRGPARAAVADVPGINAFGLVTSGQSFVPSAATEQLITDQMVDIIRTYGDKGWEIVAEMMAEAEGMNAWFNANGGIDPPVTVNDVIAVTAFIGSIFGAGGGAEASNAEYLSKLQNHLGADTGRKAWEDTMLFNDPEAPTTITKPFNYPVLTGGPVTGSATIDEGSINDFDPREGPTPTASATAAPARVPAPAPKPAAKVQSGFPAIDSPTFPAAGRVPAKQASNFLIVDPTRSATEQEPGGDGSRSSATTTRRSWSRFTSPVRASRRRASPFRPRRCTSSSVGPRTTRGASRRRTRTCVTSSPRSSATSTAPHRRARRITTCSRVCASRSTRSTRARSTASRSCTRGRCTDR